MHIQHESQLDKEKRKVETAHKTLVSVQEKHKADILHIEAEYQHQKSELEVEIRKQRERTVSLLAEKDRDIEVLKASVPIYDDRFFLQNPPDSGASAEIPGGKSEEERAVSRLLNMSSLNQGDSNLFYRQELSRKEVEVNTLRKQKHELESALRELQLNSLSKEESLTEQMEMLREEVLRIDRCKAREGANLEYLKNVTYKFLTSFDPKAKQQMLNAITTILQFSPQEKSVVHTQMKSWWGGTQWLISGPVVGWLLSIKMGRSLTGWEGPNHMSAGQGLVMTEWLYMICGSLEPSNLSDSGPLFWGRSLPWWDQRFIVLVTFSPLVWSVVHGQVSTMNYWQGTRWFTRCHYQVGCYPDFVTISATCTISD